MTHLVTWPHRIARWGRLAVLTSFFLSWFCFIFFRVPRCCTHVVKTWRVQWNDLCENKKICRNPFLVLVCQSIVCNDCGPNFQSTCWWELFCIIQLSSSIRCYIIQQQQLTLSETARLFLTNQMHIDSSYFWLPSFTVSFVRAIFTLYILLIKETYSHIKSE